jgi:hypothetical protein
MKKFGYSIHVQSHHLATDMLDGIEQFLRDADASAATLAQTFQIIVMPGRFLDMPVRTSLRSVRIASLLPPEHEEFNGKIVRISVVVDRPALSIEREIESVTSKGVVAHVGRSMSTCYKGTGHFCRHASTQSPIHIIPTTIKKSTYLYLSSPIHKEESGISLNTLLHYKTCRVRRNQFWLSSGAGNCSRLVFSFFCTLVCMVFRFWLLDGAPTSCMTSAKLFHVKATFGEVGNVIDNETSMTN